MASTTDVPVLKNKARSKPILGQAIASGRMQRTSPPETVRFLVAPELLAVKSRRCAKFGLSITLSRSGVLTCGLTAATANLSMSTPIRLLQTVGRLRRLPVRDHHHQPHAPEAQ